MGGGGGGYGNDQNLHSGGANGVSTALNPGSFQLPPSWGFCEIHESGCQDSNTVHCSSMYGF
jgi:hypothetical protein